ENSKAVLFGAVGGPKWDNLESNLRPELGILNIRKRLDLYANLRPVKIFEALKESSPVKSSILNNVDILIIRELTSGLYFGEPKKQIEENSKRTAVDTMYYDEYEIERIVRMSFIIARSRMKKLTSVDKSNVLETSKLWRKIVDEVAIDYPDVTLHHILVDNAAMQIILNPSQFDVIVSENTFGDILSDEASILSSSLGMLPSASLSFLPGENISGNLKSLYEPIHGSAPDIAGMDIANPLASILSLAMMLRYSLALSKEAHAVEEAVEEVLNSGYRNYDIMSQGKTQVGTREMGDLIAGAVGGR
ncbi:MAG: 3-isopropylmalate dehydrogenase, partial [Dehalococcoidales bacterium]|nr:3-isopropylmalate dehydrogenase [Dehalococcoidales bacterium]